MTRLRRMMKAAKKRSRSSHHMESDSQLRSSGGSAVPTRLSKRTREYMVDALRRWCTENPGAIMPSKEEKRTWRITVATAQVEVATCTWSTGLAAQQG